MTADVFTVENFEIWGELVETWATGDVHPTGGTAYPRPTSIAELKTTLAKAGAGPSIPARYKNLVFAQSTDDTLVITLPEKSVLDSVESNMAANPRAVWALPAFFADEFDAKPVDPNLPLTKKLTLLAMRIGDYTLANCAD